MDEMYVPVIVTNAETGEDIKDKEQLLYELVCSKMISKFGITGLVKLSDKEFKEYKEISTIEVLKEVEGEV